MERADAAEVTLDGKRVQTLGVNPSTFRAYTPKPTAKSDRLWRNVSAGEVVVSFVLGNDGGMPLGKTFTTARQKLRVGAYATMGMGSIDAVVSKTTARALGIPQNNALVVSAPQVDSVALRRTLLRVLPKGGQIAVINPVLKAPEPPIAPRTPAARCGRRTPSWPRRRSGPSSPPRSASSAGRTCGAPRDPTPSTAPGWSSGPTPRRASRCPG
ncbi:hypothetical protein ACFQX6_49960 [Streptosporangium lutulentum]